MKITDETVVRFSFHEHAARGDGRSSAPTKDVTFGILSLGWSSVVKRGVASLLEDSGTAIYHNMTGYYRIAVIEPTPAAEPKAPRFTVAKSGPTRHARLMKDGNAWLDAVAYPGADMPGGVMGGLQRIADLLNQHGEG